MKVNIEVLSQPHLITIVEDDLDYIKKTKEKLWHKFKAEYPEIIKKKLSGFRSENAPRSLGESKFDLNQLYGELFNEILTKGLRQTKLEIVSVDSNNVEIGSNDGAILISVQVSLQPTIKLGEYKQLNVKYKPSEVKDEEVEAQLQRLREANAVLEEVVKPAEMGDIAHIEFVGVIDGVEFEGGSNKKSDGEFNLFPLEIGGRRFIKGFEEQVVGMKIDETKKIDIIFPADYHKHEFRNKKAIFTTTVRKVAVKKLSELNDEFVKSIGYQNLLDARNKLKDDLISNKSHQNESVIENQIMTQLLSKCEVSPIPQKIIENQLNLEFRRVLQQTGLSEEVFFKKINKTRSDFDREHKFVLVREIKVRYILEAIAEKEKIQLDDDEKEKIALAESQKRNISAAQLKANGIFAKICADQVIMKTLVFVKENAKIETENVESPKAKVTEVVL